MTAVAPAAARRTPRRLAGLDWLAGECGLTPGPVAGFGAILAVGYTVAALAGGPGSLAGWALVTLGAVLVLTVNALIPWQRCPTWTTALPAMLLLADIATLREVAGPVAPAVPVLFWVPIIYAALVLRRGPLSAVVGLAVVILMQPFLGPLLGADQPVAVWEVARAALFGVTAPVIAAIVSTLVATRRSDAARIARLRGSSEAVVRSVADGLVVVDAGRRVVTVNEAAGRILGRSPAEHVGAPLEHLLPGLRAAAEDPERGVAPAAGTGEYTVLGADDRIRPLEVTVSPLLEEGGTAGEVVAFRDISARLRDRRIARVNLAVTTELAAGPVTRRLPALAAALGEALGAAVVSVYDLHDPDPEDRLLTLQAYWEGPSGPRPHFAAASGAVTGREGLPARVLASGRPEWIDPTAADAATFPRVAAALADGLRTSICLPLGSGAPTGLLEVVFDHAEAADELTQDLLSGLAARIGDAERRERLEAEATRHKDEFFALVSHELRTPLTSISGYLELLVEELEDDSGARRFLEIVGRNTQRLRRLVEDLLFVARVDAGQLTLRRRRCDLADVAHAALEVARPLADAGGLTLRADLRGPVTVHGDDGRLGQVLDNLLSNAVKFTPAGRSVTLTLSARTDPARGRVALLEVADTGMGMAPADLARLFTRFARSSRAEAENIPGVGLGLVISRAIVEAHGGTVGVTSSLGQGTTFRVELPLSDDGGPTPTCGEVLDAPADVDTAASPGRVRVPDRA